MMIHVGAETIFLALGSLFFIIAIFIWNFNRERIRSGFITWPNISAAALIGTILISALIINFFGLPDLSWEILGFLVMLSGFISMFIAFGVTTFLRSSNYMLLPISIFGATGRRLTKMYGGKPASQILYAIGKEIGMYEGKAYVKTGLMHPGFIADRKFRIILRMIGFGKMRVIENIPGSHIRFILIGSPESCTHPVDDPDAGCHLTRGFFAGVGSMAYPDTTCEAIETSCSIGGKGCEYILKWYPKIDSGEIEKPAMDSKKKDGGG